MAVNNMDEFSIIDKYFSGIGFRHSSVSVGSGDDCAVFNVPVDNELCTSTDTLISGVHFPLTCTGDIVAQRSLVANLSDLAAMGASPVGFLLSLSLPEATDSWLSSFANRLSELSELYRIMLVGGNIAKGPLTVTITVLGTVPKGDSLLRSSAQVGEAIFVTGELGMAAAGLKVIEERLKTHDCLKSAYLYPSTQLEFAQSLRSYASACIDISDGFLADLSHLCDDSNVGAEIETRYIFLNKSLCSYAGSRALDFALYGGDDYELCFSVPFSSVESVLELAKIKKTRISQVGCTTATKGISLVKGKTKISANIKGYKHF